MGQKHSAKYSLKQSGNNQRQSAQIEGEVAFNTDSPARAPDDPVGVNLSTHQNDYIRNAAQAMAKVWTETAVAESAGNEAKGGEEAPEEGGGGDGTKQKEQGPGAGREKAPMVNAELYEVAPSGVSTEPETSQEPTQIEPQEQQEEEKQQPSQPIDVIIPEMPSKVDENQVEAKEIAKNCAQQVEEEENTKMRVEEEIEQKEEEVKREENGREGEGRQNGEKPREDDESEGVEKRNEVAEEECRKNDDAPSSNEFVAAAEQNSDNEEEKKDGAANEEGMVVDGGGKEEEEVADGNGPDWIEKMVKLDLVEGKENVPTKTTTTLVANGSLNGSGQQESGAAAADEEEVLPAAEPAPTPTIVVVPDECGFGECQLVNGEPICSTGKPSEL